MRITGKLAGVGGAAAASVLALAILAVPWAGAAHWSGTETITSSKEATCAAQGYGGELKVDSGTGGSATDGTRTASYSIDNGTFHWESNFGVDAVLAKAGNGGTLYLYDPPQQGDSGLDARRLSHVSFCYNPTEPPKCDDGSQPPCPTTEPPKCDDGSEPPCPTTEPPKCEDGSEPPCPTEPDFCTGHAFDLRVDTTGILQGFAGPAIKTDPDVFPDKETFSNFEAFFPLGGATAPIATALTLEAENSGDPATGCTTRVKYEDFELDLNNLSEGGGIPVVLTADVIEAIATATLNPDGTAATNTEVTIIGGSLAIGEGAEPQSLAFQPDPNTTIIDEEFGESPNRLQVKVVLHETEAIPNGIAVNAIRIVLDLETEIPGVSQSVDVKIAHAEADAHAGS